MKIDWLKTFIMAAKYENFRKASERLFLTQAAVSKHVARLEEELHVSLFKKEGRAIKLTAAGSRFLTIAKQMVGTYDDGLGHFEQWRQGYERKLRIAVAPQIATSILPKILRKFMVKYPTIEVFIDVTKSYDIGEYISTGVSDIGLSRMIPVHTNVDWQTIHEESAVFVGSSYCAELTEGEVFSQSHLIAGNHPTYWEQLIPAIQRFYPKTQMMEVNQVEITKRFIEEGLGVSYLPYTLVKKEIAEGKLIVIPSDRIKLPTSSTYIVTNVATEDVDLFSSFLKQEIIYSESK